MSKQTATEWLFAHLLPFLPFSDAKEREHFRKCLAEAKAMEREQHKDTWVDSTSQFDNAAEMTYKKDFEDYYNKTYK